MTVAAVQPIERTGRTARTKPKDFVSISKHTDYGSLNEVPRITVPFSFLLCVPPAAIQYPLAASLDFGRPFIHATRSDLEHGTTPLACRKTESECSNGARAREGKVRQGEQAKNGGSVVSVGPLIDRAYCWIPDAVLLYTTSTPVVSPINSVPAMGQQRAREREREHS
jgi:hypothetical protein